MVGPRNAFVKGFRGLVAYLEDGGFTGDGPAGGKRPFSAGRYRLSPRRRWGQDVPQGTLYAPAQNRQKRPPNGLQGPRSRAGWSVRSWPAAAATPAAGWWACGGGSRPDMRAPGAGPAGVPPSCYRPSEGALRRCPGSLGRCPGDAGAGPPPQLGGEAWGATERATDALVLARTGDEPELPAKKRLVKADEGKREAFVADYANLWDEARRTGDKVFFADEAHFRADAELRGKWVLRGEPAPRFHGAGSGGLEQPAAWR